MNIFGKALLLSLGIAASAFVSAVPASAQYYGRGYESGRYDRYDRGQYNRRNLEAQKRAIRAQREAQRRGVRGAPYGRGYVGGGRGYGGNNGPTGGGFVVAPGPAGGYAVPVMPGNAGRYGNPNN